MGLRLKYSGPSTQLHIFAAELKVPHIEAVKVMSEYPQDGSSSFLLLCYDYHVDAQLQNCAVHCVLRIIGCVMAGACLAEREYPQDGGHEKKLTASFIEMYKWSFPLGRHGMNSIESGIVRKLLVKNIIKLLKS